jgi:hypothetical protein
MHYGHSVRYIFLLVALAGLLSGCGNTRYLAKDQVLLKKNEVSVQRGSTTKRSVATLKRIFHWKEKLLRLPGSSRTKKRWDFSSSTLPSITVIITTDTTGFTVDHE